MSIDFKLEIFGADSEYGVKTSHGEFRLGNLREMRNICTTGANGDIDVCGDVIVTLRQALTWLYSFEPKMYYIPVIGAIEGCIDYLTVVTNDEVNDDYMDKYFYVEISWC